MLFIVLLYAKLTEKAIGSTERNKVVRNSLQNVKPVFLRRGERRFSAGAGVLTRIDADTVAKDARKVIGIGKAAGIGDKLNRMAALAKQDLRVFDAHEIEVFSRRDARLLAKAARQILLADLQTLGKFGYPFQKSVITSNHTECRFHDRRHVSASGRTCAACAVQ